MLLYPLVMTNIAIEHGPYIVDLPILKVVILQFAKPTNFTGRLVFSTYFEVCEAWRAKSSKTDPGLTRIPW